MKYINPIIFSQARHNTEVLKRMGILDENGDIVEPKEDETE